MGRSKRVILYPACVAFGLVCVMSLVTIASSEPAILRTMRDATRQSLCGAPRQSWWQQHVFRKRPRNVMGGFGPVVERACPTLPLGVLGQGDEEKRICGSLPADGCLVFSLGSNNQWTFEQAVLRASPACVVHTFDCTLTGEQARPPPGVVFHSTCMGHSSNTCGYSTLMRQMDLHGVPQYLKVDIEGYEYETLLEYLMEARMRSTSVVLPAQIAVEVHRLTSAVDLDRAELAEFANALHALGGYTIVHRRDNDLGHSGAAAEFLLIKG